MYPGSLMASAPCSYTATFSRARRTSQYLRPSRAPTTWSLRTSWTTTAGDRKLGMAGDRVLGMVSTRRRTTTPPACNNRSYAQGRAIAEELSFDVKSPADYNDFQQKFVLWMRNMLMDRISTHVHLASGNVVAWIPRLPPQVDAPALMNLTLHAGEKEKISVTLSVRTDNLYVVGFRNSEGRWFELRHDRDRAPMIPGSTILRFDGRYDQGGIGELSTGDAILGRGAIVKAIEYLSSFQGADYKDEKDFVRGDTDRKLKAALRVLIVNFIESVRFHTIAGRVATQMSNTSEDDAQAQRRLHKKETLLIRNWGGLSHALIQAVNNPALRDRYLRSFNLVDAGVNNPALHELGMALVSTASTSSGHNAGAVGGGLTLAEVVGVVINDNLDGTITINDGFGEAWKLNNRTRRVRSGWEANLAYPPRPISGADDFVIDVNLNHKAALVQVAVWNPRDALSGDYNRILKGQVTGENCDVEVQYAVLTDAVVAVVEVDANVAVDSDVYGSVTARTAMASGQPLQYSLLDKARVPTNAAIPLQRKLVSAPLGSTLQVSASFWNKAVYPVPDHEIASASFNFHPRRLGTDTAENGKVRVKVTWSVSFSSE